MSELPYKIQIPSVEKLNRPFSAEFGRINVLLGSNGTGKSKVLQSIKTNHTMFGQRTDIAFVEGGRTFTIPNSLAMNRQTLNFSTLDKAEQSHKSKRSQKLSERITEALFALDRMGEAEYRKHSDAVMHWESSGRQGPTPKRAEPPLNQLCSIFGSIFPEIELKVDPQSKSIECKKNGSEPYQPAELSDGEKQVFCLIADLLLLSKGNPLIIVDEPELNLHPSLAIDLWSLIESTLPEAAFVYATHSVAFAIRPGIDSLVVLPRTGLNPISVKDISDVDQDELRSFLGAIPAILANSKAIAVEGEKRSLDTILYRWLVNEATINVEAVGSCHNVVSAVRREGIWKTVGDPQKLVGVIDRDFRADAYLSELEKSGINILPFHEIETVLGIPSVVVTLSQRLGLVNPSPNKDQIENRIFEIWRENYLSVAIRRTFEVLRTEFTPSITREEIAAAGQNASQLEACLVQAYEKELQKIQTTTVKDQIIKEFRSQVALCQGSLEKRDVLTTLRLMPGKLLVGDVLKWTGSLNIESVARAATKHLRVSDIPEISEFSTKLRNSLGLN